MPNSFFYFAPCPIGLGQLSRRKAHASHNWGNPEAKPRSRATVGSRAAGLTLDGGESGGNPALSADAVALCLRVFMHLASRGWRPDLLCSECGLTARVHCGSVGPVAPQVIGLM